MSEEIIDAAVGRVEAKRPDLSFDVRTVADALTGGDELELVHQAQVQRYLWWSVPRSFPEEEWGSLVDVCTVFLDEIGLPRLAAVARSDKTGEVLTAWGLGDEEGRKAYLAAIDSSGVDPPDTPVLAWGSMMREEEARALGTCERALGDAIASGELVPGAPRWRSKAVAITTAVLTRPFDIPPGQTMASLVVTERVGTWIDAARHPEHKGLRSKVANRLLNPIGPPADPGAAVEPVRWLLELARSPGAGLTQSHYLARAFVLEAVERFGWWDWETPPHSEADVHQLGTLRQVLTRLHLLRRSGRKLHTTARGIELLGDTAALWSVVAAETEDAEDFTRMVTEMVALVLLQGRIEDTALDEAVFPMLAAQRWSTSEGPISERHVGFAVARPLRWWRLLGALDEERSRWEYGTARQLSPHTIALTAAGEAMVLAYLRARATGPRSNHWE